jgi:hypothetical protein
MAKRTIAVLSYATTEGKSYDRGQVVELSDAEIERGSALRAFEEDFGKDTPKSAPKPAAPEPPEEVDTGDSVAPVPESAVVDAPKPKSKPKPKA